jgi:hypothetical protein
MLVILAILTVHFVADFVFQSSQMAINKSKSIKWLSIHVGVYGLVSLLSTVAVSRLILSWGDVLAWWALNVLLHFIVDFFTSKVTSKLWEQKNMRLFFTMIGFDQLLHNICLIGTYYYFLDHQFILKP